MRSIGQAARQARRARKLTQEDVADRVGVSTQFYGRIERGYALPSVTTLRRMLEVLDLRADELLGDLVVGDDGGDGAEAGSRGEDDEAQLSRDMDSPRLRRLMRFLRRASPETLHVVEVLLDQMDRAGALRRGQGNGSDAPDTSSENGEPEDDPEPDDDAGEPDDDDDDDGPDDARRDRRR